MVSAVQRAGLVANFFFDCPAIGSSWELVQETIVQIESGHYAHARGSFFWDCRSNLHDLCSSVKNSSVQTKKKDDDQRYDQRYDQ
jgi:hypothetical protein